MAIKSRERWQSIGCCAEGDFFLDWHSIFFQLNLAIAAAGFDNSPASPYIVN